MIYYLGFALKQSNTTTNKSLEGMSSIYRILIIEVADGTWLLVLLFPLLFHCLKNA